MESWMHENWLNKIRKIVSEVSSFEGNLNTIIYKYELQMILDK